MPIDSYIIIHSLVLFLFFLKLLTMNFSIGNIITQTNESYCKKLTLAAEGNKLI